MVGLVVFCFFLMKAFCEPASYRGCLHRLVQYDTAQGEGQGGVKSAALTLFGRLYFQPSGLLQGWYLHPKSASHLSTQTASQISPLASEHAVSMLNYGSTCSFLDPESLSSFLAALKRPTFPNRQLLLSMKSSRPISSNTRVIFFLTSPNQLHQADQTRGNNYCPLLSLFQNLIKKNPSLYQRRVPFYRAIPSDTL